MALDATALDAFNNCMALDATALAAANDARTFQRHALVMPAFSSVTLSRCQHFPASRSRDARVSSVGNYKFIDARSMVCGDLNAEAHYNAEFQPIDIFIQRRTVLVQLVHFGSV